MNTIQFLIKYGLPAFMEIVTLVKQEIKRRQLQEELQTKIDYAFVTEQERLKKLKLSELIK